MEGDVCGGLFAGQLAGGSAVFGLTERSSKWEHKPGEGRSWKMSATA